MTTFEWRVSQPPLNYRIIGEKQVKRDDLSYLSISRSTRTLDNAERFKVYQHYLIEHAPVQFANGSFIPPFDPPATQAELQADDVPQDYASLSRGW